VRETKAFIVSGSTGEIIKEIKDGDSCRVTSAEQIEFLKQREQLEDWEPEHEFIKVYPEGLEQIADILTGTEMLILVRLIPYISYHTGMLIIKDSFGDKRPIIQEDIMQITGYKKNAVVDTMDKLVRNKIMSRNKVGCTYQYFVNPYIFFKGKYINKTLKAMFKNYKTRK
jgi:hypothetical protein